MSDKKEYIAREAVLNEQMEICHWDGLNDSYDDFVSVKDILAIPAADVVEVQHGHWYDIVQYGDVAFATCSVCGIRGKVRIDRSEWGIWHVDSPYCPKCGANMDGGKNNVTNF